MAQSLNELPRLRQPAILNAAEYWLAPERFARRCEPLGDRFVVSMPGIGAVAVPHPSRRHQVRVHRRHRTCCASAPRWPRARRTRSCSARPGSRTSTVPSTCAGAGCSCPPFHGRALTNYQEVMRAQDRASARALALRTADPVGRPHAGDLARGDHRRRLRRHRPRPCRAPARRDARADARGQLAAVLRPDDHRTARKQRLGRPVPADPRARWPRSTRSCSKRSPSAAQPDDLDQDDVLGMFLRARDEHGAPMPDDELCDAMRTLLLGGHETTASTLTWILERVTRHPDVLARLEAAALDGDDDYIDAVIKETMRLRPVFPITARLATEPFELPGPDHPGRHARDPAHHARSPPARPVPRPARLPPRALPRHPRRHLHVDPVRRRTQTLHRRRVLPPRNPNRAAHDPPPRRAHALTQTLRTRRPPHRHDRARPRRHCHPQPPPTRDAARTPSRRRLDVGRLARLCSPTSKFVKLALGR